MQLCRWTYSQQPCDIAIEIFVSVEAIATGPGYGLDIQFEPRLFAEEGTFVDEHGAERRHRKALPIKAFPNQAMIQAQVNSGVDPLLARYGVDLAFQTELLGACPQLAAIYDAMLLNAAVAPAKIAQWDPSSTPRL